MPAERREQIFSPSMLDSFTLSLVSGSGASGGNFSPSQSSSGRSTRSASASALNSSSKPPSTRLEVRAVAAHGIYESLTIHRLAVPLTQKAVLLHNPSATEVVTSFGKAGTGYCAIIESLRGSHRVT